MSYLVLLLMSYLVYYYCQYLNYIELCIVNTKRRVSLFVVFEIRGWTLIDCAFSSKSARCCGNRQIGGLLP